MAEHPLSTDEQKIEELLSRGVVEVIDRAHLDERLRGGKQLRVKLGIDPTSPNLHVGRAVTLLKLRDFQQLGHKVVLIVGDFTGLIGDTSDKESERPMLTDAQVEENKRSYFEQMGKLINLEEAELHYNSEWLAPLTYRDIGAHADLFSVSDFIARENIKHRLEAGKRVSLREVLYPLMQGYDSVAIEADVELGGTDQRFNLLAGRTLQERYGQEPQDLVISPLIPGLDGRKMSSSWGNTINLNDEPFDMFGKVMRLADELVVPYFINTTRVSIGDIDTLRQSMEQGALNPRDAKLHLAHEIVSLYHGDEAAAHAQEQFTKTFSEGGVPDDAPQVEVKAGSPLVDVLLAQNLIDSKSEFRRLIGEGAIFDVERGEKITDADAHVERSCALRIGKKRFITLRCAA